MEATYKVDPVLRADHAPDGYVSLLLAWGDRMLAMALCEGHSLVVGRAEPADWIVDDRSLSRTHARLSLSEGRVTLEDLDSTNGCLLNGARVHTVQLGEGDVAQLGTVELRVCAQCNPGPQDDSLSHAGFMRALDDEVTRARLFGRTLAVIALKHADSPELQAALVRALRPLDRLCVYAPGISLVLLPEQDSVAARRWLQAVSWRATPEHRAGLAAYPAVPCAAEQLVTLALAACRAAPAGGIRDAEGPARAASVHTIVQSASMLRLHDLVSRAARAPLPVLIQGETGTGKELVARSLHEKSSRAKAPFRAINCAAIPASLIESILFGHERGAFTGAERQTQGVFEQAKDGTVFLDEVAELSDQAQATLLRVLDQRCVVRVGGTREIGVNARVVAATHRDLSAMVDAGKFRADLMFRLAALTLKVPPLRERREEIVPLAELFLTRAREQWQARAHKLSDEVREALMSYRWPGNVRQLRNAIERAATVSEGEALELDDLPPEVWEESGETSPLDRRESQEAPTTDSGAEREPRTRSLPARVREFEMAIIRDALEQTNGSHAQASRMLGVPRRTLTSKIHSYGLGSTNR